jgi:hypothetical protein
LLARDAAGRLFTSALDAGCISHRAKVARHIGEFSLRAEGIALRMRSYRSNLYQFLKIGGDMSVVALILGMSLSLKSTKPQKSLKRVNEEDGLFMDFPS